MASMQESIVEASLTLKEKNTRQVKALKSNIKKEINSIEKQELL